LAKPDFVMAGPSEVGRKFKAADPIRDAARAQRGGKT